MTHRADRPPDRDAHRGRPGRATPRWPAIGLVYLFEDWLAPYLASGQLQPVLPDWWLAFPGPYLYYPGRRHLPAPLRAFIDFLQAQRAQSSLIAFALITLPHFSRSALA